jgi:hypothetical protein
MSLFHHIDHDTLSFFSEKNVKHIQDVLQQKFFDYYGKNMIAHPSTIISAMKSVYRNEYAQVYEMNDFVINHVFAVHSQEIDFEETTRTLDKAKVARFDPSLCIRQHPPIKLREKRPSVGYFNMNY